MSTRTQTQWAEHALAALADAGYRRGGARTAVVEALAEHDCAVTALDLEEELRGRDVAVGRASVYRALEQLEGSAWSSGSRSAAARRASSASTRPATTIIMRSAATAVGWSRSRTRASRRPSRRWPGR